MRLLNKTQMNFAYGMGAAVVIIGALMKITHFQVGFLTGNLMLTIGLVTEAIIFALSAFDPPAEDYAWEEVYPELAGGKNCLLYTSPSPRDKRQSRMPSSA